MLEGLHRRLDRDRRPVGAGARESAEAATKPTAKQGKRAKKTKQSAKQAKQGAKQAAPRDPDAEPANESENREGDDAGPIDDVEVPPPSGPLALYRAKLEGAFTVAPVQIVRVVDGAAVWIPARR